MGPDITKEIIFNYLKGGATALEKQLIEEWGRDKGNREQFFKWLYEYEKINEQYPVDIQAGFQRYQNWLGAGESGEAKDKRKNRGLSFPLPGKTFYQWLAAASVFLMVSGFAGWIFRHEIMYQSYQTSYGEVKKVDLSDGSKVVLNANSVLSVPRFGFGTSTRAVHLTGEASFNVVHTIDHQRFVVLTDKDMNIEVLGTEFNVYSRARGTRVVLNKGKVQLNYHEGQKDKKLTMQPGDLVTLDVNNTAQVRKTKQPSNYSAWKFHRFVFENTTFQEIGIQLEEYFGTRIVISDKALSGITISGSFTAMDAEELLEILSEASDFDYEKKGNNKIVVSNRKLP